MESFEEVSLVWTAVPLHTLSHILPFTSDSGRTSDGTSTLSESGSILCTQRIVVETTELQSGGLKLETETERTRDALLGNFGTIRCQVSGQQLSGGSLWLQKSA